MGTQHFDYQELINLIELIKVSSQFTGFRLRSGDIELELRRGSFESPSHNRAPAIDAATPPPVTAPQVTHRESAQPKVAAPPKSAPAASKDSFVVTSPMVGTVYRASAPGATPFVEVGQSVEAGTTV